MNWWQAVLAYVVGPGLAAAGAVLAARYAGKSSKHAADQTAQVAEEANAVAGFEKLVQRLEAEVARLGNSTTELGDRLGKAEHEIRELRDERRMHKAIIRRLWDRLQAAVAEIRRLGGTVPPDHHHDIDRISLILDSDHT